MQSGNFKVAFCSNKIVAFPIVAFLCFLGEVRVRKTEEQNLRGADGGRGAGPGRNGGA